VRLEIDSEIAAYPSLKEAPSFCKTRAFGRSKAVVWLDSEYAVTVCTKGTIFGAVECQAGQGGRSGKPADCWGSSLSVGFSYGR
jgi:hypothetical protein